MSFQASMVLSLQGMTACADEEKNPCAGKMLKKYKNLFVLKLLYRAMFKEHNNPRTMFYNPFE